MPTNRTVWVVSLCYPYEGCDLRGVFSTKEKAEAYADANVERGSSRLDFEINEVMVDRDDAE